MSTGEYSDTGMQAQEKPKPTDPMLGLVLEGRYELTQLLGAGGMGAVYKANHLGVGKDVAVKIMHAQFMIDERTTMRFKHEVKAMSSLSHPNLIGIIDAGTTSFGSPYFVMEYLPSRPLSEILQEEVFLPADRTKAILLQIADALAHAHDRHIIHRDLKPPNILVIEGGAREHVKVVDLGVAKLIGGDDDGAMMKLTRTGEVFGSPLYMAPEQVLGRAHDGRTDIYQLGCVMFEMLTGVPPLVGASAILTMNSHVEEPAPRFQDVMPDLPMDDQMRALEEIVLKCLEKDPNQRFQTMREFMQALEFGMAPKEVASTTGGHSITSKQKIQNAAVESRIEEARRREEDVLEETSDAEKKHKLILYSVGGVTAVLVIIAVSMFVGTLISGPSKTQDKTQIDSTAVAQPTYRKYDKDYPVVAGDLYDVRVLSVYEGKLTEKQAKNTDARAGNVLVDVQKEGKPLVLVLNSYQPTTWTITRANKKVKIKQVFAVGYHPQEVDGLPPKTFLTRVYYPFFNPDGTKSETNVHSNAFDPFYFTYVGDEDVFGSNTYESMKKAIEKRTRCQLHEFQGIRTTDRFEVK
jgi:serine/threonine protein kinase